jgi:hypothetical protein
MDGRPVVLVDLRVDVLSLQHPGVGLGACRIELGPSPASLRAADPFLGGLLRDAIFIVHQPVILAVAFVVVGTTLTHPVKLVLVVTLSFLGAAVIAALMTRIGPLMTRIGPTKQLLGVKA